MALFLICRPRVVPPLSSQLCDSKKSLGKILDMRSALKISNGQFLPRHARRVGSLSTRVFETRRATGRGHFACQDRIVSQIFILLVSRKEKILSNVNVVGRGRVKSEDGSLPVTVRVSKTRVLKLSAKGDYLQSIWSTDDRSIY